MRSGIRLHDLTAGYDRRPAIEHVSGTFEPGTLTAIIGANGAGKTTLIKAIAGLLAPASGHVERFGAANCSVAHLPQQAEIDRSFPITVMDTVLLGHWRRAGIFKAMTGQMRHQAEQALDAVGLAGCEKRPIAALSAGQFQRMLFARVILQDCPIILLDEPFNAVDADTTADLLELVHRWHGEQRTVIAVLHDMAQVRDHFSHTLLLDRTVVDWNDTASVLQSQTVPETAMPDWSTRLRATA